MILIIPRAAKLFFKISSRYGERHLSAQVIELGFVWNQYKGNLEAPPKRNRE